jgi:hypothetical protein
VIYVKLLKALYGTLQAALLFWQDLTSNLESWEFTVNPYDPCVMNNIIDGKQCTVLWHVDDLKISHVDPDVVSDIIAKLNGRYGKEEPMTVTRGKVHEYLGMTINYSIPGKVQFTMNQYIKEMLEEAPSDMNGIAITPAADHLFTVNNELTLLSTEDGETFHHLTAKLLHLSKRARPDIQTAVAFLTTRVQAPDEDDWKKLGRVIKYL